MHSSRKSLVLLQDSFLIITDDLAGIKNYHASDFTLSLLKPVSYGIKNRYPQNIHALYALSECGVAHRDSNKNFGGLGQILRRDCQ